MLSQQNIPIFGITMKQLQNKKGLLIDIDDTLIIYNPAHNEALKQCFEYQKSFYNEPSFYQKYKESREIILNTPHIIGSCRSKLLTFHLMYESIPNAFSLIDTLDEIYWQTFIDHIEIKKDGMLYVDWALENNYPIGVVTDMLLKYQLRKLEKINLLDKVHSLTSSEEVGVEKPAPLIFEKALKKLALNKQDVIMVGNCPIKDGGASLIGIDFERVK
jgi:FMN phosphatase YigB (HAD superfamily)